TEVIGHFLEERRYAMINPDEIEAASVRELKAHVKDPLFKAAHADGIAEQNAIRGDLGQVPVVSNTGRPLSGNIIQAVFQFSDGSKETMYVGASGDIIGIIPP